MADAKKILDDMIDTYRRTSSYRDDVTRDVGLNREKYEQYLDEMWAIYRSGNMNQVYAYKQQIQYIKDAGFVVKRSKSTGKHKIV